MINKFVTYFCLLVGVFLQFYCYAQNEKTLEIQVFSLYLKEILPEMQVKLFDDTTLIEVKITDNLGKVKFESLKKWSYDIVIEDINNVGYKAIRKYISLEKNEITQQKIYLKYKEESENSFFRIADEKYSRKIETNTKYDSTYNAQIDGYDDFKKELSNLINYPLDCLEKGIQGKVFLSFIVNEDGFVSHVQVERGVDLELDKEAIRVLRYSSNWKPSVQKGVPIKTKLILPIIFSLR
jgi:TonB family protein